MGITTEELRGELAKLGKKELEINALLYPEPKPTKEFPNILIGFLNLRIWLEKEPAPRQKPLRAALGRFVGKKYEVLQDAERFLDNPQNVTPPPYQLMEKIRLRQNSLWNALLGIGPARAAFNPARDWEPRRAKVFIDI